MNKIVLVGRLTKDTELQTTTSGISLCRFNVACKSKQKDENGDTKVDFFVCVAWREKAELIHKYCKKGTLLQISGNMSSRNYEKQDGTKQTIWEVNVEDTEFLSSSGEEERNTEVPKVTKVRAIQQEPLIPIDNADDDCPF